MSNPSLAERLVAAIPDGCDGLFNPWRDRCQHDTPWNGPEQRLERLAQHLDCEAKLILCGEAPGYQGCRYAGIAFTSERLLGEGAIPRIPPIQHRLSTRRLPFSEPSATIVWGPLYRRGLAETTVLWNALQLHPHLPWNPWSNRTPTDEELAQGEPALRLLLDAFPSAKLVAVGKKAEKLMLSMGITPHTTVRHPANGGAAAFASGIEAIATGEAITHG